MRIAYNLFWWLLYFFFRKKLEKSYWRLFFQIIIRLKFPKNFAFLF